jgi:cell division protein FtsB
VTDKAEDRLVVVRHVPGLRRRLRVTFAFVSVVSMAFGYWVGQYELVARNEHLQTQLERVSANFADLQQGEAVLRQQVTTLESGRAIDDLAKQEIKNTIRSLEETVSQLTKDVAFYKNIMAPSDNARGLQLQSVDLKQGSTAGRYGYKLVLAQVADNKAYLSGVMAVNLIGQRNEMQEVIPLRDISQEEELGITFRFKYFQEFSGELTLPDGFEPDSIQIVAQASGKKASRIEQSFAWKDLLSKKS